MLTSVVTEAKEQDDITVEFDNVKLFQSNWTMHGFNVVLNESNLIKTDLRIYSMYEKNKTKNLHIMNTSFGAMGDVPTINIVLPCERSVSSTMVFLFEVFMSILAAWVVQCVAPSQRPVMVISIQSVLSISVLAC